MAINVASMSDESHADTRHFVNAKLPWIVGLAGFVAFIITLNPWISFHSLDIFNQVFDLAWRPTVSQPLTWAVTSAFRLFPGPAVPTALNIFSAVCASLVLVLLARTVALLPHHRISEERSRDERPTLFTALAAWVPVLLATIACAFQLSFWENATAISGEMIDLLLFAYVIRCLFEFKRDKRENWLTRSALVYGIGMADNWGFIGFLPVYIGAMAWLKKMEFLDARFLLRMGLRGIAGSSLCLLLPIVCSLSKGHEPGFFGALAANLRYQYQSLLHFPRLVLAGLALTTLVPILVIALCRKSDKKREAADNEFARFVGRISVRLAHGLFLALSAWLALDLPFSPRNLGGDRPLLCFYFLNALVMGYCAGFFLRAGLGRFCSNTAMRIALKLVTKTGAWCACLMIIALPTGLILRNYGQICLTNSAQVRRLAEQFYESIPAGKCIVLGDSPDQLILLRGALAGHRRDGDAMLVDVSLLPFQQYQAHMARQFPLRWPQAHFKDKHLDHAAQLDFAAKLGATEPLVCINPGFGYYQDPFAQESKGLAHRLTLLPPNRFSDSRPDESVIAINERYWQQQWNGGIRALIGQMETTANKKNWFTQNPVGHVIAAREANFTSTILRAIYARALDDWGVQMQRANHWAEASVWFERSLQLKPDNLSAGINLLYNQRWQQGQKGRLDKLQVEKLFHDQFSKYAAWERIIIENGPVDEPTFLNETARVLLFENNNHQAAADYARCVELAPNFTDSRLWFAQSLIAIHDFTRSLELTETLLNAANGMSSMQVSQLLFCRASALQGLGRTNDALNCVNRFVADHEGNDQVMSTAISLCMADNYYASSLPFIEKLLARHPDDAQLLSEKAIAQMKTGHANEAIVTLSVAITRSPTNELLRINRAAAFVEVARLDDALADYQQACKISPRSSQAWLGICEMDWRKKDSANTIRDLEHYLAIGVPQSAEYQVISNRLRSLKTPGQSHAADAGTK